MALGVGTKAVAIGFMLWWLSSDASLNDCSASGSLSVKLNDLEKLEAS